MFKDTGFFEDLKKMDKQFFFVGLEPPLPTDLDEIKEMTEKGLVIIFGDCAVYTTRNSYWVFSQGDLKGKVPIMPGCPPFACAQQAT